MMNKQPIVAAVPTKEPSGGGVQNGRETMTKTTKTTAPSAKLQTPQQLADAKRMKQIYMAIGGLLALGAVIGLVVYLMKKGSSSSSLPTSSATGTSGTGTNMPVTRPPGAPTNVVATVVSSTSVSVSFSAPTLVGTSATITSYTVTSTPGNVQASGTSSPIVVSSLTAGTSYTFTVTATNASGTSIASAASSAITTTQPSQSMYADSVAPLTNTNANPYTVGSTVIFKTAGQITALRMYVVVSSPSGGYNLTLRSRASGSTTTVVETVSTSIVQTTPGWVNVTLATPVTVNTTSQYIVSFDTKGSPYPSSPFNLKTSQLHLTQNTATSINLVNTLYNAGSNVDLFASNTISDSDNWYADVVFTPSSAV